MDAELEDERPEVNTISLLLTMKCNFRCDHCFYECGPEREATYVSTSIVDAALAAAWALQTGEVNLVGGEPTLNLPEFERVFSQVADNDLFINMTTNGWWLDKPKALARFLWIVRWQVESNGGSDMLSVRISNDKFHRKFWKRDKTRQLEGLWDNPEEMLPRAAWYCTECNALSESEVCPECGQGCMPEVDYELLPLRPNPNSPWIYVEKDRNDRVVPNGRGRFYCGDYEGCLRYSNVSALTYRPDGIVTDPCCRGGSMILGTYQDDPLAMFMRARRFTEEVHPQCFGCLDAWNKWSAVNPGP